MIVGTDGSAAAGAAVVWAADEAVRHGRSLRIVHVEQPWVFGLPDVPSAEFTEARAAQSGQALEEARSLAAEGRPGLEVTIENVRGDLIRTLADLAPQGTELVLGRRGHGAFADLLLGSTSLRLAGHLARPVIVVRGGTAPARGEVVVGVALDHNPKAALTFAFAAARARGAQVRAIHVWEVSDAIAPLVRDEQGFIDPLDRLADLMAPWREMNDDVKVVEELSTGQPVAVLTEVSAGADLLVVGSHGRGPLTGALLGSVGHGVLHHAHCPVAVIPTH
ncbi:universal stress protein [Actinocorallia longicatena]|uniref:Universal stress protein n=1 Tax=Actinocorallia longicatena TaxID=111803 RepID=A0ABP6QG46_9ACTN